MRSRLLIAMGLLVVGLAVGLMALRALYPMHWHAYLSFRGDAPSNDGSRWKLVHDGFSPAPVHGVPLDVYGAEQGFVQVPFISLGDGSLFLNEKHESRYVRGGVDFFFPFPGVPVDFKAHGGRIEFAFRRIFDGSLYRLSFSEGGKILAQQRVDFDGIDFPIFRAAASAEDGVYWVVYDNKRRKNYLLDLSQEGGGVSQAIELPSFFPPAGSTYEMEPPVFLKKAGDGEFVLIAGGLHAAIKNRQVSSQRMSNCEVAVEVIFPPQGPVVLCRAQGGASASYFLRFVNEGRDEPLDMAEGVPWKLQQSDSGAGFSLDRAKTDAELMALFRWDLERGAQGGLHDLGVNNVEGRIPWSQIYYLNGLMDSLLLYESHQDGRAIFSGLADDLRRRIVIEMQLLDRLLDADGGFHTKAFTHDRSPALFAVQTSRLLLLFDRYSKEFSRAPSLKNREKLHLQVTSLEGHIEQLAKVGEDEHWMKKGTAHLRWPKCSAFYFDGMAVPFNHQNEWAYALFNAADVRGLPKDSSGLADQRDIIRFFMNKLAPEGGFPRVFRWYYWYGHAYDGWRASDGFSCNTPAYSGDDGLAWISFRTIDFMSVLAALDFMSDLDRNKILTSGFDAVKYGDVYPFAARSLLQHGVAPQIQRPVLRRYYRAVASWELSNLPWALSLGVSAEGW